MKVFNSKLAAIGLAAFVFASCSDNTSDPHQLTFGMLLLLTSMVTCKSAVS